MEQTAKYPWYDSYWVGLYDTVRDYLERNDSKIYKSFEEKMQVFKTCSSI